MSGAIKKLGKLECISIMTKQNRMSCFPHRKRIYIEHSPYTPEAQVAPDEFSSGLPMLFFGKGQGR